MKSMIALLILTASTFASAATPRMQIYEMLPNVKINGVAADRHVGILNLNFAQRTMDLEIQMDLCGTYQTTFMNRPTCRSMPITVASLSVPLTAVDRDRCGAVIYRGFANVRETDRVQTEIQVTDLTTSTCEIPLGQTLIVEASQSGVNTAPESEPVTSFAATK